MAAAVRIDNTKTSARPCNGDKENFIGGFIMTVIAMSIKDKEYLYKASTAHTVSKSNARKICDMLNSLKYKLDDDHVWFVHEVDKYDNAYIYAERQKFTLYKGTLKEKLN